MIVGIQVMRPDRYLAVPARDVEHIGRPRQAGDTAAQLRRAAAGPLRSARGSVRCQGRRRAGAGNTASPARPAWRGTAPPAPPRCRSRRAAAPIGRAPESPRAWIRRIAVRASGVNSRAWLACSTSHIDLSVSKRCGQRSVTRSGSATGTRVWMRRISICGIADSAWTIAASRRGDSISGSPPVRITSRIAGRGGEPVIGCLQFGRRSAGRHRGRHARGGSRSGNRPGRSAAASAARGPGSGAPRL